MAKHENQLQTNSMTNEQNLLSNSFIADIRSIIEQGRRLAYDGVNTVMISTYWSIGRRIVEEEQGGADRAAEAVVFGAEERLNPTENETFAKHISVFRIGIK